MSWQAGEDPKQAAPPTLGVSRLLLRLGRTRLPSPGTSFGPNVEIEARPKLKTLLRVGVPRAVGSRSYGIKAFPRDQPPLLEAAGR